MSGSDESLPLAGNNIRERLSRCETQIAGIWQRVADFDNSCGQCRAHVAGKVDHLVERIHRLEVRMAYYVGAAAVLAALGSHIFEFVISRL